MKFDQKTKVCLSLAVQIIFTAALCMARVTPNTRTFNAGENAKIQGVIVSREGDVLKLRATDDSIGTIDLTNTTKIELKHGLFGRKKAMDLNALVPGLQIQAEGEGNEKGDLVASRVIFDPNSMRASRQIDTRVSPLEARTGSLEGRTGQLEGRTGTLENRTGELETQEKNTQQQVGQVQTQVGQVKTEADQANQGVNTVNGRVSDLDNYQVSQTTTVYFRLNSAVLSPQAKQDLDALSQKALQQKAYVIEVAGFADKTGNAARNQQLSDQRAAAVIRYLEQQGNIPIHRILRPAGMGTSHEAASNDTAEGRKMNRRVEVRVLVNQGIAGTQSSANSAPAPANPAQQ
jgi:outer membrane protein OmpA-like peptidoglycan-associated protein